MLRLYLVRHGQTAWNSQQKYQGHTDVPLDEVGLAQSKRIAERLASLSLLSVYSSDMSRAAETARAIADVCQCPALFTSQLRESGFGEWEGKTRKQIEAEFPNEWAKYRQNPLHNPPPNGEALLEVQLRINSALKTILTNHNEGNLAIVGHGGSLRWILVHALNAPSETYFRFHLDNASLSAVEYDGDISWLVLFNDSSHLGDLLSDPTTSIMLNK